MFAIIIIMPNAFEALFCNFLLYTNTHSHICKHLYVFMLHIIIFPQSLIYVLISSLQWNVSVVLTNIYTVCNIRMYMQTINLSYISTCKPTKRFRSRNQQECGNWKLSEWYYLLVRISWTICEHFVCWSIWSVLCSPLIAVKTNIFRHNYVRIIVVSS